MSDKKSIVVVDDSDMVLTQCREMLGEEYRVRTLNSALNLLRIAPSIKPVPDMILLDIEMEEMSGAEALPEIRSTAGWENVPILLLTSWSADFLFDHLFLNGVMDVIHKPIIPSVMHARIKNYLKLAELSKA
ncbi:MAG: response regulator [Defluviitaleaceae bacterium]|nr:response regulator [Defluviitaleaceae bacterium]